MKKRIFCLILIIICIVVSIPFVSADEYDAKLLNKTISASINGKKASNSLFDGSMYTKYMPNEGDILTIKSEQDISYVYIKYNKPPTEYQVKYDGGFETYGKYGFLHELIRVPSSKKQVIIHLPQVQVCDIYVYSDGVLPSSVEQWEPPFEDCDILLLPTHADDEHLFFGSIMPYYAGQLNKKVQVAYLTNHWGEWYRPHELLEGIWEAGVKNYPVISVFNDYYSESLEHAKTLYDNDKMLGYEVELIRRFKPEVIIGHDVKGEYGHGVHMLNTYLLKQAIEISNDATYYPESAAKYGVFEPQKTYLHLYDKNTILLDVDTPLPAFGGKTAFEKAQDAFSHHKSQQKWFKVSKKGVFDLRKFGLYKTTVGYDTTNDILEHVTFSDEKHEASSVPESSKPINNDPVSSDTDNTYTEKKDDNTWNYIVIFVSIVAALICLGITLSINKVKKKR